MEENRRPQPGDLIWADRSDKGLPYNHCGIYESAGYVIHFASPEGSEINQENAVVHRTSFEHFKDGCTVKVIDIGNSLPAEETLRRAYQCIGMKGYNFTSFNCDHFATWCKTGKYRSIQVEQVKTILKELDNPLADVIVEAHDIEEKRKAQRLDKVYPAEENEIEDTLETNSIITETDPPVADDENDIEADYEIMEDDPCPEGEEEKGDTTEVIVREDNTGKDDGGILPPAKKAWYEKVGDVLKGLTYPVSGALEYLKRTGKIPVPINFLYLGAKVRNVIDNVVNKIKVFTGRLTPEQAAEERRNNEVALAGMIVAQKQKQPIRETLKQVFGKVGSVVKHVVQQVVTRVVPAPVRKAIKFGAQKILPAIVSGIKSFVEKAKEKAKGFFASIKRKIFG